MKKKNEAKTNRLSASGSPYLRQHASNPVDWHPWSDEVFAKAVREDKPVFLSIGYSACHWCHVMEEESFSDPEVADLMNDAFINVKVDREERPDVDHLYMTVCQLLTGSGGWPLTIVMTPDRKPFFAGTYFPKGDRHSRSGMLQIVPKIKELWASEKSRINESAREIHDGLSAFMAPDPAGPVTGAMSEAARRALRESFDSRHGGFGTAPKFPVFSNLAFLLGTWNRTGDEQDLTMVRRTLDAMRSGGIYDHAGFGFHRYSTDDRWFAPHFEKMLYDQALAVFVYAEAFAATGESRFRQTAEEVIAYVARDLMAPGGAFYSAEDADSEGEEGRFYTWTEEELKRILDSGEMTFLRKRSGVTEDGNFLTETRHPTGRNILFTDTGGDAAAADPGSDDGGAHGQWKRIREKLMAERGRRVRPLRDEKIMTDWNGLMIAALARAGAALGEGSYIRCAEKAAGRFLGGVSGKTGTLTHLEYADGTSIPAFLDDYAFMLWGVMELHQASGDTSHIKMAVSLAEEMAELFQDVENGGFTLVRRGSDPSLAGLKPAFDGPMPSGNSVAAVNLIRLGRLTGRQDLVEMGEMTVSAFAADMNGNPAGFTHMAGALDLMLGGSAEVVIVGYPGRSDTKLMISSLQRSHLPFVNWALVAPGERDPVIPYASNMEMVEGRATAHICRNFACRAPVTDPRVMLEALGEQE